jgi:7-cyano-7-deazaguanine synthase
MKNKRALVILSGGQDSTTCLFWALEQFEEVQAITFDYGQRHRREIQTAETVAKMAGVKHEIVRVPTCLVSSSPLTSDNELEKYNNAQEMEDIIGERVELTFVPMRNTFFFVIAMNRAVAYDCQHLVTGICEADNANYPDCTDKFRSMFEDMANQSLGLRKESAVNQFMLHAPLMHLSKAQTCQLAYAMPKCWEALAYTHTSYDGQYPPTDNNHANVLRADGFEKAGLPDPLVLRAVGEGLMQYPRTANYDKFFNGGVETGSGKFTDFDRGAVTSQIPGGAT